MEKPQMSLIVRRLELRGMRVTSQRKQMIQLFMEARGFLQPKDIYERMIRVYPGISHDTIYRNIRVMKDIGIVEQFEFEDGIKYKFCSHTQHHHHLICLGCEEVIPFQYCPMSMVKIPESFAVVRHKFEVFGYCGPCARQR